MLLLSIFSALLHFPSSLPPCPSLQPQAIGFSLVPYMPSVWSLTTLYFIICFSYNFTNSAVFTSLGWMFPKRAGGALNLVSEGGEARGGVKGRGERESKGERGEGRVGSGELNFTCCSQFACTSPFACF